MPRFVHITFPAVGPQERIVKIVQTGRISYPPPPDDQETPPAIER